MLLCYYFRFILSHAKKKKKQTRRVRGNKIIFRTAGEANKVNKTSPRCLISTFIGQRLYLSEKLTISLLKLKIEYISCLFEDFSFCQSNLLLEAMIISNVGRHGRFDLSYTVRHVEMHGTGFIFTLMKLDYVSFPELSTKYFFKQRFGETEP